MSTHAIEALDSGALGTELLQKVRATGLVVWLDADGAFTGYADRHLHSGHEPRFMAYRGSFLELMLAIASGG